MRPAPRAAALLAFGGLVACVHYPLVVPSAFNPPPKHIAVVAFHSDRVRDGLFPARVVEVQSALQLFQQALYASQLFLVADTNFIAANPVYQQVATSADHVYTNADPLRPLLIVKEAATTIPVLAQALGADVIVVVHFSGVASASDNFSNGLQLTNAAYVEITTDLVAWDAHGNLIWRDSFDTDSTPYVEVLGISGSDTVRSAALEAIGRASKDAVSRLQLALVAPR